VPHLPVLSARFPARAPPVCLIEIRSLEQERTFREVVQGFSVFRQGPPTPSPRSGRRLTRVWPHCFRSIFLPAVCQSRSAIRGVWAHEPPREPRLFPFSSYGPFPFLYQYLHFAGRRAHCGVPFKRRRLWFRTLKYCVMPDYVLRGVYHRGASEGAAAAGSGSLFIIFMSVLAFRFFSIVSSFLLER